MDFTLHVWRQNGPEDKKAGFETFKAKDISPDISFLEMLDQINDGLIEKGEDPIAFDHDCREGICGMCSLVINGRPHGHREGTTVCQLHMREFKGIDEIYVEPWRANAFPIIKDLVVNRSSLDRIIEAGGFISVRTGSAPEANLTPIRKEDSDIAFDAATCIGCGACVAACPNASAMLFTAAKVSHLSLLPQGHPERYARVADMVRAMDEQGFGGCTNHRECEAACPKRISHDFIARLNREFLRAATVAKAG
jgi:succinate dehydrogenase / fumarate reductase iron-sulfur subunit